MTENEKWCSIMHTHVRLDPHHPLYGVSTDALIQLFETLVTVFFTSH